MHFAHPVLQLNRPRRRPASTSGGGAAGRACTRGGDATAVGHASSSTFSNLGNIEYCDTSPASTTFSALPLLAHVLRTRNCTAKELPAWVWPYLDLTVTSCKEARRSVS